VAAVADDLGIAESSLRYILDDDERLRMYFYAESNDDRKDAALDEIRPLDEPSVDEKGSLEDRVDELESQIEELASGQ